MNGGSAMSPSIAQKTFRLLRNNFKEENTETKLPEYALSTRETNMLEFLSKGLTNKAIAERLFISPFTVKRHIENIYQKLQAHNRTELLDKARKGNLL